MKLLNKIQKELKVPKSQFNSFGNYNYRNCEDILEAVKPLLGKGTLVLSDELANVNDRVYVKAYAVLTDENGKTVEAHAYARESLDKKGMDSAQITGAASSYARKYALNGLFLIDDTKDADSDEKPAEAKPEPAKATPQPPKQVVDRRKAEIKALADEMALNPLFDAADYKKYILEATGLELVPEHYLEIIERLKAQRN